MEALALTRMMLTADVLFPLIVLDMEPPFHRAHGAETGNSQSANEEDAAQRDFASGREFQPPDLRHRQEQDREVDDDVGDVGPDQPRPEIHAAAVGYIGVPGCGDGTASEDCGQEGRGSPRDDQGEENVDDVGERLVDAENAQVQAQDGRLDGGDDGGV